MDGSGSVAIAQDVGAAAAAGWAARGFAVLPATFRKAPATSKKGGWENAVSDPDAVARMTLTNCPLGTGSTAPRSGCIASVAPMATRRLSKP